jgi:hypothetical protein
LGDLLVHVSGLDAGGIGGQIGPRLQGVISHRIMERAIGVLFSVIGAAMLWIVFA